MTYSAVEPLNLTHVAPYDEIDQFIVAHPPLETNSERFEFRRKTHHPGCITGGNYEPDHVGADGELKRREIEPNVAEIRIRSQHPLEGGSEYIAAEPGQRGIDERPRNEEAKWSQQGGDFGLSQSRQQISATGDFDHMTLSALPISAGAT